MPWKDHLDKVGIVGSFVAAACCLGLPAIVSIIAAIGLGFLINDAILLPVMIFFLVVTFGGLFFRYRVHRQPWALLVGGVSSIVTLFFIFVHTVKLAAYVGIAGLVLAGVLNVLLSRKSAPTVSG